MNNRKLWTTNFTLITLMNFFLFFAFQLFPTALPPYLKSLGAPDSILGWLQGILTIATLIARPFAGIALDNYGRRGIFLAGLVGIILVTAAYWFFPVVAIILLLRFAHGLVWGIVNTACNTVATDNIGKERFAEGMGWFSLASSIAIAIAPAVALALGITRNITLALAFLAASLVLFLLMRFPKAAAPAGKGTGKGQKKVSFYAIEAALPSAIMFLIMITWGAVLTFLALYGAEKSLTNVGLFFTVYAGSMLVTRPYLGKLIDRKGFGIGIWSGVILVPAAMLLLSVSSNLPMFLLCAVIYGIGNGAAQASLQTMAVMAVDKEKTGAATATFFTGFDGGIGVGAVLSGILVSPLGYGGMYACISVFPILAGILYFVGKRRRIAG